MKLSESVHRKDNSKKTHFKTSTLLALLRIQNFIGIKVVLNCYCLPLFTNFMNFMLYLIYIITV